MDGPDVSRAINAAISIVSDLGLAADRASVVNNSNKVALHLQPCSVLARVAHVGKEVAALELHLAQELAAVGAPAGALEPRIPPSVHERDGFAMTLWTYYEQPTDEQPSTAMAPADYADALARLHVGMRQIDVATPNFTDRIDEAADLVADREQTPDLAEPDRAMLASTLKHLREAVCSAGHQQLLHGEPHPGNVLVTPAGPRFIDLETCCRGPIEFDLAHVPRAVSDRYPDADSALLADCRHLVLAMVAAWRWDRDDQFPNGREMGRTLVSVLRSGPPWPTLDEL